MAQFERTTALPVAAELAYQWHDRPGAFERLQPPWEGVRLLAREGPPGVAPGAVVTLSVPMGPLRIRWVAEHDAAEPGRWFRDVQRRGPFARWTHTHRFEPMPGGACRLVDHIDYALPLGGLGQLLAGRGISRKLERVFAYRHRVTAADLADLAAQPFRPQHILLAGGSGLIGQALRPLLTTAGHTVRQLVRAAPGPGRHSWNPPAGELSPSVFDGIDTVIHLGGASIADGRWTAARKQQIRDSRVQSTSLMARQMANHPNRPTTFIVASAIGYYGSRGDQWLDETSSGGAGFLADVCRQWEAAVQPALDAGIRVVHLRLGVVLTPSGGALAKMLTPFQFGVGGPIGDGRQYWSWIALDDVIAAIHHAMRNPAVHGPVNLTAPHPVTCRDFARVLGRVLHRPALAPMPAFAARLALGEMADELLLASTRVRPAALLEAGYAFRFPELESALRHLLGAAH